MLALMFSAAACMAACGTGIGKGPNKALAPDSAVYAMLGRTMSDVLFHPSSVVCYTLRGKAQVGPADVQVEPHWVRDSLIGTLPTELVGVLQFSLIANSESYRLDSVRIKAPYFPVLAFEFKKKKNSVYVIVSPSDCTWTVMYDDKRQLHFNYQDRELVERFCNYLLSNEK